MKTISAKETIEALGYEGLTATRQLSEMKKIAYKLNTTKDLTTEQKAMDSLPKDDVVNYLVKIATGKSKDDFKNKAVDKLKELGFTGDLEAIRLERNRVVSKTNGQKQKNVVDDLIAKNKGLEEENAKLKAVNETLLAQLKK
jgi:vacuolar-type H+-ATPase subunit I/STV1